MRFPEPYMEEIEAEAKAEGISVPELCRRIIIERNEALDMELLKASQVESTPKPLTQVKPVVSPAIGTPSPELVRVPTVPTKSELQKRAQEALVKLVEKNAEELGKFVGEQFAKGKMSRQELVDFLTLLE
jgi:hypothetical protein